MSNSKAYVLLFLTVLSLSYNTISTDFTNAGFQHIAKYVVLVGGIATALCLAYTQAISGAGPVVKLMARFGVGPKQT